ncbi:MAG: CorA family divalent cation transporter [Candidatus Limnocylindria bacterium]
MNFADMPGLREPWGFLLSLGLMLGVSVALFVIFRRRRWL